MNQLHVVSVGPAPSTVPPLDLPTNARWFTAPGAITAVAVTLAPDIESTGVPELAAPGDYAGLDPVAAGVGYLVDGDLPRDDWTPRVELTLGAVNVALAITASFPGEDCVLVTDSLTATLLVSSLTGEQPDVDGWRGRRQVDHCILDLLPEDNFTIATGWGA
ncbi:MAG: hypothetical protein ACTH2Q_14610 [Propionibacteriaceae bacterium]